LWDWPQQWPFLLLNAAGLVIFLRFAAIVQVGISLTSEKACLHNQ
jgi:hypothetical protein